MEYRNVRFFFAYYYLIYIFNLNFDFHYDYIIIIIWPALLWFFCFSTFFSRIACCSRESTSAWQNLQFPTKIAEKEENNSNWGLRFFFQKWACASRFQWGIFIFLAAEKLTFLEGGTISKLARQWPSWGIYKYAPPVFWRKRRLLYSKKVVK